MALRLEEALESNEFVGEQLVLTAGIRYDDTEDSRFEHSLLFAEEARTAGVPVIFVDGTPPGDGGETPVADAHRARDGIVLPAERGGIAMQRKQGVKFAVAHGAEKVVGTESEKVLIPRFAGELSDALDGTDVLVVGRTQAAEDSLPPVQQTTERLAGWILGETHYLPHDPLAGPRGFTAAGAEVLADYPATKEGMNNWIYLYTVFMEARRRGLAVDGIDVEFVYPEELVEQETGNETFDRKRYDQFSLQLNYLLPKVTGNDHAGWRARDIAQFTLTGLQLFTPNATNQEMADAISAMEDRFAALYGYEPADRLRVQ